MHYDQVECGKRISQARTGSGLTQLQAADALHVSVQHYRSVEAGRRGPSIELLVDISVLYHTSLDYLILGNSPEPRLGAIKKELRSLISHIERIENAL